MRYTLILVLLLSTSILAKTVDLQEYRGRLQLMIDPFPQRYWNEIATPKPFLSDYFGLHIIKNVNVFRIARDFRGYFKYEDDKYFLEFNSTCKAEILPEVDLVRKGMVLQKNVSLLWFFWSSVPELIDCYNVFYDYVASMDLTDLYFYENSLYEYEKELYEFYQTDTKTVELESDFDGSIFNTTPDAVMFAPDFMHGDHDRYDEIYNFINNNSVDWVALEMYPKSAQWMIDVYLLEEEGSMQFRLAKDALIQMSWTQLNPEDPFTENNKYFQLLKLARSKRLRVYALDTEKSYSLWSHGETPIGVAIRNSIWNMSIPIQGRGILFGGSGHFKHYTGKALNIYDFVRRASPDRKLLYYPKSDF